MQINCMQTKMERNSSSFFSSNPPARKNVPQKSQKTKARSFSLHTLKSDGEKFFHTLRVKKVEKATNRSTRTHSFSAIERTQSAWKNFSYETLDEQNSKVATSSEEALSHRISNCRSLIRQGTFETKEVDIRKRRLSIALQEAYSNNEVSKFFYRKAKIELQQFDEDLRLGNEEVIKNIDNAYMQATEMNNRSLEFYKFISENNICATEKSIINVRWTLKKIEKLFQDETLSGNAKQKLIFALRGNTLMDSEQSFLLEELKVAACNDECLDIENALLIIKRHLTHDLKEDEIYPHEDDVFKAYDDLKTALTLHKNKRIE